MQKFQVPKQVSYLASVILMLDKSYLPLDYCKSKNVLKDFHFMLVAIWSLGQYFYDVMVTLGMFRDY